MEMFLFAGIVLISSILESFVSIFARPRNVERRESKIDQYVDNRYVTIEQERGMEPA